MEINKGKRKVKEEEEEEEEEEERRDEEISKLVLGIMEGYSDSVIPPLSSFMPGLSWSAIDVDSSSKKRPRVENVKERDRRVKMNDNFSLLESIVPGLLPKSTKEKVLQRTIEYIEYLEERKKVLEKLKDSSQPKGLLPLPLPLSLPSTTTTNASSLSITVCGRVGFFGIRCSKRQGLMTKIFMVFHNHQAEVLASNVVAEEGQLCLTVTALVNGDESHSVEMIKREILML